MTPFEQAARAFGGTIYCPTHLDHEKQDCQRCAAIKVAQQDLVNALFPGGKEEDSDLDPMTVAKEDRINPVKKW